MLVTVLITLHPTPSTTNLKGRIGEVLIFGAALPPAHRDEVSQYLAQKWAVTDFSATNFVYDFGPHTITTAAVHTLVCSFIDHTDAAVSTSISVTVNPGPPSSLSSSGASGGTVAYLGGRGLAFCARA